jgi:hypothetical protein
MGNVARTHPINSATSAAARQFMGIRRRSINQASAAITSTAAAHDLNVRRNAIGYRAPW